MRGAVGLAMKETLLGIPVITLDHASTKDTCFLVTRNACGELIDIVKLESGEITTFPDKKELLEKRRHYAIKYNYDLPDYLRKS